MNKALLMVVFVCGAAVHTSAQTPAPQPATPVQPTTAAPAANAALPTPSAAPVTPTPISTKIVPGSRVYITPMDGFENYLAAALGKKKVQLIPVTDKDQADYVITGTSLDKKAGWAKIVFTLGQCREYYDVRQKDRGDRLCLCRR
jgi:hypothetical protein